MAADNIDIMIDTLDGKGTFHATQMVMFKKSEYSEEDGEEYH